MKRTALAILLALTVLTAVATPTVWADSSDSSTSNDRGSLRLTP
jgi:hypothetical protein